MFTAAVITKKFGAMLGNHLLPVECILITADTLFHLSQCICIVCLYSFNYFNCLLLLHRVKIVKFTTILILVLPRHDAWQWAFFFYFAVCGNTLGLWRCITQQTISGFMREVTRSLYHQGHNVTGTLYFHPSEGNEEKKEWWEVFTQLLQHNK